MTNLAVLIISRIVDHRSLLSLNMVLLRLFGFRGEFRSGLWVLGKESIDILRHMLPSGWSDPFQVFHYGFLQVEVSLGLAHAADESDREADLRDRLHFTY